MIVGESKPPLAELTHHGVRGMRWGIRKAEQPANAGYSPQMRVEDRRTLGKNAVSRINKHLNSGLTRDQALAKEQQRKTRQQLAVVGAVVAVNLIARHGLLTLADISAKSDVTAIGANAAKINYVKPNRHGVHKITTMK